MSKIIDIDFRSGGTIEKVTKTLPVVQNANRFVLRQKEKGQFLNFEHNTNYYDYGDIYNTGTDDFTFVLWFKMNKPNNGNSLFGKGYNPGIDFICYPDANQIQVYIDVAPTHPINNIPSNTNNCFIFIRDGDNFYYSINGSAFALVVNKAVNLSSVSGLRLGSTVAAGAAAINAGFYRFKIYNTAFTNAERDSEYAEFLNSSALARQQNNFYYPKPTDLSKEDSLAIAYNMIPQNKELIDISGNGHDGIINGGLSAKDGMSFNGINDSIECDFKPNDELNGSDFSIILNLDIKTLQNCNWIGESSGAPRFYMGLRNTNRFRFAIAAGSQDFINPFTTGRKIIIITFNYTTGEVMYYINGVFEDSVINTSFKGTLRNFNMILNGDSSYYAGNQDEFKLYNKLLSSFEIENHYNNWAKQILFYEDFRYAPADGTNLLPKGWIFGTGSFKINELTIAVGNLEKGTKVLECTLGGTIFHQYTKGDYIDGGHITADYYNGAVWTTIDTDVDDAIATYVWLSFLNNRMIYTLSVGDQITNIKYTKGTLV